MELLIPGLILVALMVYASTKIKKSAAKAYEAETIDTPEFYIEKPDGLLNPLNDQSPYIFEAYSKEFGRDGDGNARKVSADLRVVENSSTETVIKEIKDAAYTLIDERNDGGGIVIETEQPSARRYYKIAESRGSVYRLRVSVLDECADEYRTRVDQMLSSFRVK